ncbi:MAG: GNAT family N-acetyltransferase [Anaerolineae bacterium]
MPTELRLRAATATEAPRLTALAHAAKQHWGYPPAWLAQWQSELTITAEEIATHPVFCAVLDDAIVGFGALACTDDHCELTHLWVQPEWIGQGIGAHLWHHAVARARAANARALFIVADPHAAGFYQHMGAQPAGEQPSFIAGRMLPCFILWL